MARAYILISKHAPVRLSNRVIAFNQSKRSECGFRIIQYFISLPLKWQCSKRNDPCFNCASIELWMHLGSRLRLAPLKRFSRALPTSRVHPILDRRTPRMDHFLISLNLNIKHSYIKIKSVFTKGFILPVIVNLFTLFLFKSSFRKKVRLKNAQNL